MQQGAFQGIARHFTTGGTRATMERCNDLMRERDKDPAVDGYRFAHPSLPNLLLN
jgi:hypothetical protein